MAKTPTWQRAEGKNPEGGLNEKGRASLRAAGHDIKRPQPEGGPRKDSFCARMKGMKAKNTSSETANDPDSRINKSLRKWNCADGGAVDPYDSVQQAAKGGPIWDKPRPKKLGKPEPLSSKEKASAKAAAKAAGRPYPNLIDNMRAARADGGELDPYEEVQNAANTDGGMGNFSAEDIQRASHGATPAVPTLTVTENAQPSTPAADALRGAYNAAIPPTARLLAEGAMGVHSPITERDFSQSDIQNMKDRFLEQQQSNANREKNLQDIQNFMTPEKYRHYQAMTEQPIASDEEYRRFMANNATKLQSFQDTRGQTSVPYGTTFGKEDQPNQPLSVYSPEQGGIANAINRSYNDPGYRTGMTLGRFNVYDTPQGRIAVDNYDFRGTKQSLSDIAKDFQTKPGVTAIRGAIPTLLPNIERPVAINLDRPGNYTYTGKPILTPGSHLDPEQTQTPRQDEIADYKTKTPGYWKFNWAAQQSRTPDVTAPLPPRRPAGYAEGGEIDDRTHEFVQEQLKSGEPQVPQYVAENDFPARAARGVEAVDTAASRVNNLLANVAGQPAMRSPEGRTASEVVQSAMPVDPYQAVQQAARQWGEGDRLGAAETMAAGMPMQGAIRAYHGSPHKFDRFDLSKIGTGEGAQAYGHGLYFADSEDVARQYAANASNKYAPDSIASRMLKNHPSRESAINAQQAQIDRLTNSHTDDFIQPYRGALEILRSGETPKIGHMYEVDIHANPEHMLDWDKPLYRQPSYKSIQRYWDEKVGDPDIIMKRLDIDGGNTGRSLYEALGGGRKNPENASKTLNDWGISGIKYLDQGSRPFASGDGTSNYVIFDPSLINIKRRYADGGEVEGDVQFAPDDPYAKVQEAAKLPMMAQHEYAMRMPEPEVRYDTGPQPGEATLKAYDPTIKERIYQGIAGTEERPSPERAQFARGMSQMAEFAPVLGNVMAGQEAQRRGDTKGMLMAALPVPGMATEARMAEAAAGPAQQAAQEAYQRVLNAQGLYSHAAEAAANLPQAKGSYEQMMAMLQKAGVKPEEMRWSGVEQFAGQPVTREQLVQHFEQNVPKIEETVLGGHTTPYPHRTADEWENAIDRAERAGDWDESNRLNAAWEQLQLGTGVGRPKFEQYTIPGGENYREVLLGLPERIDVAGSRKVEDFVRSMQEKHGERWLSKISPAEEKQYDDLIRLQGEAEKRLEYRSGHWDQPNVLGHLRLSDRTGPQGEKILHMEELQSDWGQAGRKQGFARKITPDLQEKVNLIASKLDPKFVPAHARTSNGTGIDTENFLLRDINHWKDTGAITPEDANVLTEYTKIKSNLGIPAAPYVESTKNWVDLGLKRALKEAAEKGYDKLVWTPGAEQAARYDLSKQVRNIEWKPYDERGAIKHVTIEPTAGNPIELPIDANGYVVKNVGTQFDGKPLDEIVGKDLAKQILNDRHGELSGSGLNVGGEGMKSFYDSIIPSRLKELMKKIDPQAKVELGGHSVGSEKYQVVASDGTVVGDYPNTALANAVSENWPGTTVRKDPGIKAHSIQITPKMREAILKGLPAYAKGGEVVNDTDPYDNIRDASKNFPRARRASH